MTLRLVLESVLELVSVVESNGDEMFEDNGTDDGATDDTEGETLASVSGVVDPASTKKL